MLRSRHRHTRTVSVTYNTTNPLSRQRHARRIKGRTSSIAFSLNTLDIRAFAQDQRVTRNRVYNSGRRQTDKVYCVAIAASRHVLTSRTERERRGPSSCKNIALNIAVTRQCASTGQRDRLP